MNFSFSQCKSGQLNAIAKPIYQGAVIVCSLLSLSSVSAYADLMITPYRVAFEDRDRTKQITIVSRASEPKTYRIFFRQQKMLESGEYKVLPDDAQDIPRASDIVRYGPRQVLLAPGERQAIKLSLRRPADLPPGEYRSHLVMEQLPEAQQTTLNPKNTKGIGLQLYLKMEFSIPVIVRHGDLDTSVSLDGFQFERSSSQDDRRPRLAMNVLRSGNGSSAGRLDILWQPRPGASAKQIGELNNVAVFPEIARKRVAVPLEVGRLEPGIITVQYEGVDEFSGLTWAKKQFSITP